EEPVHRPGRYAQRDLINRNLPAPEPLGQPVALDRQRGAGTVHSGRCRRRQLRNGHLRWAAALIRTFLSTAPAYTRPSSVISAVTSPEFTSNSRPEPPAQLTRGSRSRYCFSAPLASRSAKWTRTTVVHPVPRVATSGSFGIDVGPG